MRTKRMITRVSGVTLGLVAGAQQSRTCNKEDGPESGAAARIPVSFSAGIESVAVTRTANGGDTWTTTDRIGIIMAKAGTDIYTNGGNGILVDNLEYTPGNIGTSTTTFTPVSGYPIYYPRTGKVDFYAYYPHTAEGNNSGKLDEDYNYTIDLKDQSNPAAIDVLYADKKEVARSSTPIELSFRHVFAKVTLNVTAGDGINTDDISALKAINVEIIIETRARLAIWNDSRIFFSGNPKSVNPYRENTTSAGATFSAIVLPGDHNATPVTFFLKGKKYICTLPAGQWQPGNNYVYPVIVRNTAAKSRASAENRICIEVGACSVKSWEVENKDKGMAEKESSNPGI